MLNFTVVSPTAGGYLTVFPFGTTQPFTANLNYATGAIVGNEIAAKMTIGSATDEFSVFASGTTAIVVDAVGYFMAPVATPLDVTNVNNVTPDLAPGIFFNTGLACPAGYAITGGGCDSSNSNSSTPMTITQNAVFGFKQHCGWANRAGAASATGTIYAQCARVPGR